MESVCVVETSLELANAVTVMIGAASTRADTPCSLATQTSSVSTASASLSSQDYFVEQVSVTLDDDKHSHSHRLSPDYHHHHHHHQQQQQHTEQEMEEQQQQQVIVFDVDLGSTTASVSTIDSDHGTISVSSSSNNNINNADISGHLRTAAAAGGGAGGDASDSLCALSDMSDVSAVQHGGRFGASRCIGAGRGPVDQHMTQHSGHVIEPGQGGGHVVHHSLDLGEYQLLSDESSASVLMTTTTTTTTATRSPPPKTTTAAAAAAESAYVVGDESDAATTILLHLAPLSQSPPLPTPAAGRALTSPSTAVSLSALTRDVPATAASHYSASHSSALPLLVGVDSLGVQLTSTLEAADNTGPLAPLAPLALSVGSSHHMAPAPAIGHSPLVFGAPYQYNVSSALASSTAGVWPTEAPQQLAAAAAAGEGDCASRDDIYCWTQSSALPPSQPPPYNSYHHHHRNHLHPYHPHHQQQQQQQMLEEQQLEQLVERVCAYRCRVASCQFVALAADTVLQHVASEHAPQLVTVNGSPALVVVDTGGDGEVSAPIAPAPAPASAAADTANHVSDAIEYARCVEDRHGRIRLLPITSAKTTKTAATTVTKTRPPPLATALPVLSAADCVNTTTTTTAEDVAVASAQGNSCVRRRQPLAAAAERPTTQLEPVSCRLRPLKQRLPSQPSSAAQTLSLCGQAAVAPSLLSQPQPLNASLSAAKVSPSIAGLVSSVRSIETNLAASQSLSDRSLAVYGDAVCAGGAAGGAAGLVCSRIPDVTMYLSPTLCDVSQSVATTTSSITLPQPVQSADGTRSAVASTATVEAPPGGGASQLSEAALLLVAAGQRRRRGRPPGARSLGLSQLARAPTAVEQRRLGLVACGRSHCGVRLRHDAQMSLHERCHLDTGGATDGATDGDRFGCYVCSWRAARWLPMAVHLWRHHRVDVGLYRCHLCDYRTVYYGRLLRQHLPTHGQRRAHACGTCGGRFKNAKQLANHQRRQHRQLANPSVSYGNSASSSGADSLMTTAAAAAASATSQTALSVASASAPIQRPAAPETAATSATAATAADQLRFACPVCQRHFDCRSSMLMHVRRHKMASSSFVLPTTTADGGGDGGRVTNSSTLLPAGRVATTAASGATSRQYACNQCSYSSGDHNTLRRHMMRHSGERPYRCSHCSYSCIQASAYQRHVRVKHAHLAPSVLHSCRRCHFRTVNAARLLRHSLSVHGVSVQVSEHHHHHQQEVQQQEEEPQAVEDTGQEWRRQPVLSPAQPGTAVAAGGDCGGNKGNNSVENQHLLKMVPAATTTISAAEVATVDSKV